MLRSVVQVGVLTVLFSVWSGQSADAQVWWSNGGHGADPIARGMTPPRMTRAPGRLAQMPARPVSASRRAAGAGRRSYPQLDASMYPSPQPNIPHQVGGTIITNQAFAPHEMLYPHTYRAMYPPYYYKATGGWIVTPWGVWSHDNWKLLGTEVEVKYKSRHSHFSKFALPVIR